MDVARLNLSHGTYAEHVGRYRAVRAAVDGPAAASASSSTCRVPKIRLGPSPTARYSWTRAEFTITGEDVPGDAGRGLDHLQGTGRRRRPGDRILVDDGRVPSRC